jgi:hypothetical protein
MRAMLGFVAHVPARIGRIHLHLPVTEVTT